MKAQVVGLQETLRDLNKLDKELSKEIRKDIRKVVQPLANAITASVPAQAPLSGLAHSGRTGWSNRKKVAVKLDTRKPRRHVDRPGRSTINVVRSRPRTHRPPSPTWLERLEAVSLEHHSLDAGRTFHGP